MILPGVRALILAEQARQGGRFVEGVDLDGYIDRIGTQAEWLIDWHGADCRGFVAFYANDLDTRRAFITSVLVAPAARGQGLGRGLVEGVLAICRARGFRVCGLEVRGDNTAALALYETIGFRQTSTRGAMLTLEITL